MSALISIKLVLSQTPANTVRPWTRASASRGVPVYSHSYHFVLTGPTHGGMTKAE